MLCEFYQNPCHFVFDDLTLDVMFKQFKEGNKGHVSKKIKDIKKKVMEISVMLILRWHLFIGSTMMVMEILSMRRLG